MAQQIKCKAATAVAANMPCLDIAPEHCKIHVITDEADQAGGGVLEGYASVFDNVDLGGDVVKRGAFAKTIRERLKKGAIKLVDSHLVFREGTDAIVGLVTHAEEDEKGLKFSATFSTTKRAQEIRTKIKEGILNALSFGYDVIKAEPDRESSKVTVLKELRLYEISVVPWGMNPKALIDAVKSDPEPEIEKGVVSTGDYATAPLDTDWSASAARQRIKAWVGSGDWSDAQWNKFRSAHLWVGDDARKEGSYKFLVADVIDGSPKLVFKAAVAALAVVRGARGDNTSADWWSKRDAIETKIGAIYKKFGRELPKKDSTPSTPEPNEGAGDSNGFAVEDDARKAFTALAADIRQAAVDVQMRALLKDMRE